MDSIEQSDVVGIPLIVGYQHLNIKHTLLRYYIRYGRRIATYMEGSYPGLGASLKRAGLMCADKGRPGERLARSIDKRSAARVRLLDGSPLHT
ncbi:hypothetical protein SFRURICE_004188 [Spodoptera frugiperda]|uniref:SFRICE_027152 n=1 Tax=Spodoptera frugiperda TaxID=7108 RepID=A0A2H1X0G5_SPOFR|nr:hypothetical protein SFRURICE_004188 [Spodoptera frugiperda]